MVSFICFFRFTHNIYIEIWLLIVYSAFGSNWIIVYAHRNIFENIWKIHSLGSYLINFICFYDNGIWMTDSVSRFPVQIIQFIDMNIWTYLITPRAYDLFSTPSLAGTFRMIWFVLVLFGHAARVVFLLS